MMAKIFNESGHGYWLEGFGCIRAGGGNNDMNTSHAVVILNPHDSQGVQIADWKGIYPCGRGGNGYQQGYVLQHFYEGEKKEE